MVWPTPFLINMFTALKGSRFNFHLREGLSEPEFYGDFVYKIKKLIGRNDFSFQFRKIITRYRHIGYNLNIMRQSACLVFYPIMVDNYAAFFNCSPVGRASDFMMAQHKAIHFNWLGPALNSCLLLGDLPRRASYGVYISQLIRFARVCNHVADFNARNKCLTAKLPQQGYRYHKLRKTFSKFYRRH